MEGDAPEMIALWRAVAYRAGMRFLVIALFTLFMFTASQTAQAFDMCCAGEMNAAHNNASVADNGHQGDTSKVAPHHCCMLTSHHALYSAPHSDALDGRNTLAAIAYWPESPVHESFIGEGLIEPPSLA